jgi:hypothetical protein
VKPHDYPEKQRVDTNDPQVSDENSEEQTGIFFLLLIFKCQFFKNQEIVILKLFLCFVSK